MCDVAGNRWRMPSQMPSMAKGDVRSDLIGRRAFLTTALQGLVSPFFISKLRAQEISRPNIVLIMVDDMGRDWVSCYGGGHRTPNIDRLARQGVLFETAWCTPICTPTRVELLAGKYPFRTGWTDHHDVPRWGGKGLDWEREVTFARVLRDAGYRTAVVGKWQVNNFRDDPDVLKKHGFDEHCMWTGYEEGNPPSGERYWNPYLQVNGDRRTHEGKFGPDILNDYACDFVKRNKDRPFLLYYPMVLVHGPFVETPANRGSVDRGDSKQLYAGMVSYMDRLVGRLLQTLDETGLSEKTLVISTTDNGTPGGVTGTLHGCPAPAGKGRTTDFGVHVPLIVRAPWLNRGNVKASGVTDFTDLFPTLLEVAGIEPPRDLKLDGHSIVPMLKDPSRRIREWIFTQRGPYRSVRNERYKLDSDGRFHDLWLDPHEKRDLSASTESEVRAAREALQRVLESLPPDGLPPFEGYYPALERDKKSG